MVGGIEHYVFEFDVAVEQLVGVHMGHAGRQLAEKVARQRLVEFFHPVVADQVAKQLAALAQIVRQREEHAPLGGE